MSLCKIYRSSHAEYTYVYLRDDLSLEDLPAELLKLLGTPECIMELDLSGRKTLAQENIDTVKRRLENPGYHLQLPPEDDPGGWLELPAKHL